MAGLVTTPIQPYNFNQAPLTGTFYTGALPSTYGYDNGSGVQAWGSNNVLLIPNSSGNVALWYFTGGTTAPGICQVLVGQVLAGQVLPASTTRTMAVNESGWIGPFSPAVYNIDNVNFVPASIAGGPAIATWPNAALGCWAVAFTTTTQLLVRAYTFSSVQP